VDTFGQLLTSLEHDPAVLQIHDQRVPASIPAARRICAGIDTLPCSSTTTSALGPRVVPCDTRRF